MEAPQSPKIPFYVQRPFGEKMNASFDFFKENWKVMMKYITYLILPVCFVQALSMNTFMGYYMNMLMGGGTDFSNFGVGFFASYGFTALLGIIGSLLLAALVYALVKLYNDREQRLVGITFGEIKPVLFRNMGRLFLLGILFVIFYMLVVFVIGLLATGSLLTLILTIPAFIAIFIALLIWVPVYLFEDVSVDKSFSKAFRMGFATWGGIFAVTLVMGIIGSVVQGVTTLPWYATSVVSVLLSYSEEGAVAADNSIFYHIMVYLLGVVMLYGMYVSAVFTFVGLSYQYSHATEKLDSITVETEIDNFENL